jgi:hypothetical protein
MGSQSHGLCLLRVCCHVMVKKQQIEVDPTQEGMAVAASLQGRLQAKNRRGDRGVKKIRAQEGNLSITITRRHSRTMRETRNGNFIITVRRRGSTMAMHGPRRGRGIPTGHKNLIIADLVGSTRYTKHLGATTGNTGPSQEAGKALQGPQAPLAAKYRAARSAPRCEQCMDHFCPCLSNHHIATAPHSSHLAKFHGIPVLRSSYRGETRLVDRMLNFTEQWRRRA